MAIQQVYAPTSRHNRHYSPFKRVSIFVPKLVRKSFARYGFVNVDIVLQWGQIVGKKLAKYTWPKRIQWPRKQESILRPDGTEAPSTQKTRLVVGVTPSKVLEVEMAKHVIMSRVNTYLGYRGVTELKPEPDHMMPEDDDEPTYYAPQKPEADDTGDGLQAALARLNQGIKDR